MTSAVGSVLSGARSSDSMGEFVVAAVSYDISRGLGHWLVAAPAAPRCSDLQCAACPPCPACPGAPAYPTAPSAFAAERMLLSAPEARLPDVEREAHCGEAAHRALETGSRVLSAIDGTVLWHKR